MSKGEEALLGTKRVFQHFPARIKSRALIGFN